MEHCTRWQMLPPSHLTLGARPPANRRNYRAASFYQGFWRPSILVVNIFLLWILCQSHLSGTVGAFSGKHGHWRLWTIFSLLHIPRHVPLQVLSRWHSLPQIYSTFISRPAHPAIPALPLWSPTRSRSNTILRWISSKSPSHPFLPRSTLRPATYNTLAGSGRDPQSPHFCWIWGCTSFIDGVWQRMKGQAWVRVLHKWYQKGFRDGVIFHLHRPIWFIFKLWIHYSLFDMMNVEWS